VDFAIWQNGLKKLVQSNSQIEKIANQSFFYYYYKKITHLNLLLIFPPKTNNPILCQEIKGTGHPQSATDRQALSQVPSAQLKF
jgi:hypothetical protein